MTDKILFVIPAHNEEKNIGKVVQDITTTFLAADILVVNDCSKDNTLQVLKDMGSKIDYLNLPINLGYSGALQAGFKYAELHNYDYVIQFDGDGQHLAKEAIKLYNKIKSDNVNIVIGSRFIEKTDYNHVFFRKIGTGIFKRLIKIITKASITDPTSGFQIIDKKAIHKYAQVGQYPEFPDANLIIKMILAGIEIEEIAVQMAERVDGVSMHAGIIKPIKYMVKSLYSIVLIAIMCLLPKRHKEV